MGYVAAAGLQGTMAQLRRGHSFDEVPDLFRESSFLQHEFHLGSQLGANKAEDLRGRREQGYEG